MRKSIGVNSATTSFLCTVLKRNIFFFSLILFSYGAFANPPLASKQQIGMFKNSKTCVVLEDGISSFNVFIKDAVQKYWKSTEFEFIDQQEFEKRRFDSKYSFIILMKGVFDKDPGGVSYNYISLVLGDATKDMTKMPELCSIPISYTDDNNFDYGYVIPAIVKFMQKHAKNLEKERFMISIRGLNYYNSPVGFKDKVLLMNKDKMAEDASTSARINSIYPYYVKLLSASEIKDELNANPTKTLFHFHVGPANNTGAGKCFEMIFDTEGNLYYYNSRRITNDDKDGFNLKDFHHIR